jgi:hypothetical protein
MPSKIVRLKKGSNLLLIKLRPGYICDAIEFAVYDVRISPMVSAADLPLALGRIRPVEYFRGTTAEPRQVIEAALFNTSKVAVRARVSLSSKELGGQEKAEVLCEPGAVNAAAPDPARAEGVRLGHGGVQGDRGR